MKKLAQETRDEIYNHIITPRRVVLRFLPADPPNPYHKFMYSPRQPLPLLYQIDRSTRDEQLSGGRFIEIKMTPTDSKGITLSLAHDMVFVE